MGVVCTTTRSSRHLSPQGHDALLIPTYTPVTTDEADVSQNRIFFGGINVFLQQKSALFRKTPWSFDRILDAHRLCEAGEHVRRQYTPNNSAS